MRLLALRFYKKLVKIIKYKVKIITVNIDNSNLKHVTLNIDNSKFSKKNKICYVPFSGEAVKDVSSWEAGGLG